MPQEFTNPYLGLDESSLVRFQTYIDKDHHQFFWGIRAKNGTFTTFINILVSKLHAELNRRGITDITNTEAFEHFVANCELALPAELVRNNTDLQHAISKLEKHVDNIYGTTTEAIAIDGGTEPVSLHGSSLGGVNIKANASNVNRGVKGKSAKDTKSKTK